MKSSYSFLLFVLSLFSAVYAISETFTLELSSSEKSLKDMKIYIDDEYSITIGASSASGTSVKGSIQEDGSLKLDSGDGFVGIKRNFLTITTNYTDYAIPFAINKDGYLLFQNTKDFKAIPSGKTNSWLLTSEDAVSTAKDAFEIKVKCVNDKGKKVGKFSIAGSGASAIFNRKDVWALSLLSFISLYLLS